LQLIINTRPETTSAALQQALAQRDLPGVSLPGMAISGPEQPLQVRTQLRAALSADIWIFTSINAIEQSFVLLSDMAIPAQDWPLLAVLGQGSWHCLHEHLQRTACKDVRIITPPADSEYNSEGLLQHSVLQDVNRKQVLILNAPGGRDKLLQTLQQRGANVLELAVYRRVPPQLADTTLETIAAWSDGLLTVWTSSASIRFLQQQFAAAATNDQAAAKLWTRIIQGQHLVLSASQRQHLQQLGAVTISLASAPDTASLAQQLQQMA